MLLLSTLVLAPLLAAQQATTRCVDAGNPIATTQTQPARGPSQMSAVLKVATADDHSKNSHLCNADYQLLLSTAGAGVPRAIDLLSSDAEYERQFSFKLDGFTADGRLVLGTLSESGKYAFTMLFIYSVAEKHVRLIDVTKQLRRPKRASCEPSIDAVGTTSAGGVVVEANSCAHSARWVVPSDSDKLQRLPKGAPTVPLYESTSKAY